MPKKRALTRSVKISSTELGSEPFDCMTSSVECGLEPITSNGGDSSRRNDDNHASSALSCRNAPAFPAVVAASCRARACGESSASANQTNSVPTPGFTNLGAVSLPSLVDVGAAVAMSLVTLDAASPLGAAINS